MRKVLFALLALISLSLYAQEYSDGTFVVQLMKTDAQDLKCDVLEADPSVDDLQSLSDGGREIISVVRTKFGTLVVHKKNTAGTKQIVAMIPGYDIKKSCKKYFKQGYVLQHYTKENRIAIFCHRPDIKQEFSEKVDQKNISKLNSKGLKTYMTSTIELVAQTWNRIPLNQKILRYAEPETVRSTIEELKADGWIVNSFSKSYNKFSDKEEFCVLFDKCASKQQQTIGLLNTRKELAAFLKKNVKTGYNITGIWCGWEKRDYAAEAARAAAYDENVFDILSGLTTSISGLMNKGGYQPSVGNASESQSSGIRSKGSSSVGKGKCKTCGGNGKCSTKSGSGRKNACHGSGLCGYCNGTGWIKAGSSEAKCSACNGKGKCKTCGGSGKCKTCHGTGK